MTAKERLQEGDRSSDAAGLKDRVRDALAQNQTALTQAAEVYGEYGDLFFGARGSQFRNSLMYMYLKYKKIRKVLAPFKHSLKKTFGLQSYEPDHNPTFVPYRVQIRAPSCKGRPRVLHAIQNFATGGSSRLVIDLIEHLGDRFEQEVITAFLPKPPSYTGMPISEYEFSVGVNELIRHMQRFRPEIVHVHYWGWGNDRFDRGWSMLLWYHKVFQAAGALGVRVIENVNIPIAPYFADNVARYVYVSQFVKDEYGVYGENETVIYPGSDFGKFTRTTGNEAPENCIGMVYRLEDDKLNGASIDVFIEVARRRADTNVLIVGGGALLEQFRDRVRLAGLASRFVFTGFVSYDELPLHYGKLSVFVAPVWRESFGQVTPFAMSMGIPVVGYDVGALKEIVGDRSLLAPPANVNRLADLVIDLLDDRSRRLQIGAKNASRARELFSVQSMCEKYGDLYQDVLRDSAAVSGTSDVTCPP